MYLIIDIGNTLAKLFLYQENQCLHQEKVVLTQFSDKAALLIKSHPKLQWIVYSDVGHKYSDFFEKDEVGAFAVMKVNSRLQLPFVNKYETPDSLGSDRIVLLSAAAKLYPNTPVLIIDLGTCITYDFLDENAVYEGGAISPGFEMRYKALHQQTAMLPKLESKAIASPVGKSTHDAIHAGVYAGIHGEINARISYYKQQFGPLTVILTGGDANKLPKTLKNSIFAHQNFVAIGMLHLLELNTNS